MGKSRLLGGYNSSPLETTKPDTKRFQSLLAEHGGDHKRAAHEYFKEKLKGRHIEAQTEDGPIKAVFTGRGWGEIKKDMANDPVKAALVPHMPDVIATGNYKSELPAHNHPDISRFHTYRKSVQTEQGTKKVIVDVAERPDSDPKNTVFSMTREGTRPYADRAEKTKKTTDSSLCRPGLNRISQDRIGCYENYVIPLYEIVNLRYTDSHNA